MGWKKKKEKREKIENEDFAHKWKKLKTEAEFKKKTFASDSVLVSL